MNANTQTSTSSKMVSLNRMIDSWLVSCNKSITAKKIIFVNEVPKTLAVPATLVSNLSDQLHAVIQVNPGKNCLRISVDNTGKLIRLHIKPTPVTGFCFSGTRMRS